MNVMGLLSLHEDIFKQSEKVLNNMQLKISVITNAQKKGTTMVKKDRIDSDHKFSKKRDLRMNKWLMQENNTENDNQIKLLKTGIKVARDLR